jgi:hypothetical protein
MYLARFSLSITNSSNGNMSWVAPQLLGGCAGQDIDPCSMMYWSTVVSLRYIMIGHERGTAMVWYSAAKRQCNGAFADVLSLDFRWSARESNGGKAPRVANHHVMSCVLTVEICYENQIIRKDRH